MQTAAVAGGATHLVVIDSDSGRVLACLPLEAGVPVHFDFVNSIYLAPVRETFVYSETRGIVLVRVESTSAGVFEYYGLPTDGTNVASLDRRIGDDIRIRSLNYENHRLTAGGRVVNFKDFALNGQALNIKILNGRACKP